MNARRRTAVIACVLLLASLEACGSGRAGAPGAPRPGGTGSRTVTREMIRGWNVIDAYGVVERAGGYRLTTNDRGDVGVRQGRGRTSVTNRNADRPVLMVDGTMMMDFDMLRRIEAADIERVEFLSPADATQRFGTMSSGAGAILIVTRTR